MSKFNEYEYTKKNVAELEEFLAGFNKADRSIVTFGPTSQEYRAHVSISYEEQRTGFNYPSHVHLTNFGQRLFGEYITDLIGHSWQEGLRLLSDVKLEQAREAAKREAIDILTDKL